MYAHTCVIYVYTHDVHAHTCTQEWCVHKCGICACVNTCTHVCICVCVWYMDVCTCGVRVCVCVCTSLLAPGAPSVQKLRRVSAEAALAPLGRDLWAVSRCLCSGRSSGLSFCLENRHGLHGDCARRGAERPHASCRLASRRAVGGGPAAQMTTQAAEGGPSPAFAPSGRATCETQAFCVRSPGPFLLPSTGHTSCVHA